MFTSTTKQYTIIGLMSGSSLDGLDIVACSMEGTENGIQWKLLASETKKFSPKWIARLSHLPSGSAMDYAKTHTYFGRYSGELVNEFLEAHKIEPDFIASHGHTIFHAPEKFMTAQIGCGGALAAVTGFPVVSDFRTVDIGLEGEGTPLAPIADKYLFQGYDAYLNLGGIANISLHQNDKWIAYDISPCNQVLNLLSRQIGLEFDEDGRIAQTGKVIPELLEFLMGHPYMHKTPPKSLDNTQVFKEFGVPVLNHEGSIADKLHTVCTYIANAVSQSTKEIREPRILVSGGGALNTFLINCITENCPKAEVIVPEDSIVSFKEALLICLMGFLRIENKTNCLSSVTGALSDSIGGGVYQGTKKRIQA